ncbi:response regulator [candidate division KSB1 bacterium]|nr:response regulator [candidate division KSB1 bacterium]
MKTVKHILVIDTDQRVAKVIAAMMKESYRVHFADNGRKALHFLESNKPHLIITEIELPDMDGFEFCRHIKKHTETAQIPIIILSHRSDLDSRLTGLQLGVIDYLIKPLHKTELRVRLKNILSQYDKLTPSYSDHNPTERKMIALLKLIRDIDDQTLVPTPDANQFLGYRYPGVETIVGSKNGFTDLNYLEQMVENKELSKTIADKNYELIFLEHLAEKKALTKKIHDTIHVCPYCEHHDINFREICPNCNSIDIELVDLIHHFRCAYIGPEKDFRHGLDYVCPKCSQTLRHIGVDYEKPSRSYQCKTCQHVFSEASVNCLSIYCGKSFDIDKAIVRDIYSYTLTDVGHLAIENGHIEEATFEHAFWDLHLDLYTMPFLQQQVKLELLRSERYKRPFTLMLIQLNNMDELKETFGRIVLLNILRELGNIINEGTRATDIPARQSESEVLFLLPETRIEDSKVIAERIRKRSESFKYRMLLNICLVEFPRSGKNYEDLFSGLSIALKRAFEKGGNKTISFIRE